MMHGIFDNALFALLLAIPVIERWWTWPRFLKRLASGDPGVRAAFYGSLMIGEWVPAVCLVGYWAWKARPWSWLMLAGTETPLKFGIPPGLRLWVGLGFVALLIGVFVMQRAAVVKRPEAMERLRPKLAYAEPILPHTSWERSLFRFVSLTAGVTEELFYRGFLIWFLMAWMGPAAAVLVSSAMFGLGHIYMGWAQAPKTALVGLVMALVVFSSASLWPAMLLHAAIDWNSGELGYAVLRRIGSKPASDG
jgi:membrane protease YdiL (CAAX protease family)